MSSTVSATTTTRCASRKPLGRFWRLSPRKGCSHLPKRLPIETPALLEQFREFYAQSRPEDLEQALEFFAVFGGLGWAVDTHLNLMEAIEEEILDNYEMLRKQIADYTGGDARYHALLSGIAMGDGRIHSALKRSRIEAEEGEAIIADLCKRGVIRREKARAVGRKWIEKHPVSDRLIFASPFLRFWFAFVSPFFKGVKAGEYAEVRERFANHRQEFMEHTFVRLSAELVRSAFEEDPLSEIGSFWDAEVEIDLYGKTASGKTVAGACKNASAKMKSAELSRLSEKCKKAGFTPDIVVLVSKEGFSSEIKGMKGENVRLFTLKSFKKLLSDTVPEPQG